jgi:hypothetical protein
MVTYAILLRLKEDGQPVAILWLARKKEAI